ncbi:MAG TPA: hypothetical protein VD791_09950 [Burkholderiales bacterium]|nr:hypothetical protein [Burkholderiales bacterium]
MSISLRTSLAAAICSLGLAQPAAALTVRDWLGTYTMNHDGWRGTLTISESKADCASPAWCALVLRYVDADGNARGGRIERMDERRQQMTFTISFPRNRQRFDAYLFSHEPGKMAGVTFWQGKTFGFFAERKPAVAEALRTPESRELHVLEPRRVEEPAVGNGGSASGLPSDAVVSRRVLPSGEVERRLANGVIERISSGKIVRIMPDGTQQVLMMQQVIPVAPPPPPPGSPEHEWLGGHAQQLLDMIVALASSDPAARQNYLATESDARNVYERIARRTQTIGYLTQP